MQRQRVVDLAADLAFLQVLAQGVASRSPDDVLVEDVSGSIVGEGKHHAFCGAGGSDPSGLKQLVIMHGKVAALLVPLRQVLELHLQHSGLQSVQAGVPAYLVVIVALAHPMGPKHARVLVKAGGDGGQDAGIAKSAENFGGIETEGGKVAPSPGGEALP